MKTSILIAISLLLGCANVVVEGGETETVALPGECAPDCEPSASCDPASQFTIVCTGGVDVSALYCDLAGEQRCGGEVWCCEGTPDN